MNYVAALLPIALLFAAADGALADRCFANLSAGKMSASFNSGQGLSVSYDGVQIIRDSSMWVHNPAWNYHYYGLPHMRDDVQVRDIEGGKEAVITHKSESFDGQYKLTILPDTLRLEFRYKLLKDVSDADMEYCFGNLCAPPIIGRRFRAITQTGEAKEGTVPVTPTKRYTPGNALGDGAVSRLEIDSRLGKMTIEVSGDPPAITTFDNRLSQWEKADVTPVFWCGVLGTHLEFGKEYAQTITLTIHPAGKLRQPAARVAGKPIPRQRIDLRSPTSGPVYVIPEPQEMKLTDGDFVLTERTKIVVGDAAKPEDLRGAKSFAEEVKLLYGFEPKLVHEKQAAGERSVILVGETALSKRLASAAKSARLTAPQNEEGYAISVTPASVLVLGHDRRGTYYGMQTLKQLLKASPKQVAIQGCTISDWPSLKYRGVLLFTSNRALPFHKKLIDRIFSRFKINNLLIEVDNIKWKHDPTIALDWSMDQEDLKKDIAYANEHFIEVSPLLQSLGHCDWMFKNGRNKDLAENPDRPYAYCPSNPRTYDYVLPFYDETVELFNHPRFVHIGHDEVQEPGGFPRHEECKKRSAEQIFVDDTLKVREHLAKQGARVMMWGDMMLSKGDAPDATNAESPEKAKWIRDQLPKDVIVTDWHYAAADPKDYKSLGIFVGEGHEAIASTWFTPANIEAFAQQAKNVGALGLLQTTWAGFNSNEDNLKESFPQFSAMILAAEYAWNSGKTKLEDLPYKADEEFRKQYSPKPVDRTPRKGFVADLSRLCNESLADNDLRTGWVGLGPDHDLSAVPTGELRFSGDLFRLPPVPAAPSAVRLTSALDMDRNYPDRAEIELGRKARSLLFVHTCAWTDVAGRKVGAYTVRYSDGTSEEIPLNYGVNICSWIDQRSLNGATRMWEGRTKAGERVSLQRLVWENPHPKKMISSIEFTSSGTEAGPALIALSGVE